MAKVSPATFIAQVRAETAKVVWPTRKETTLTTVMVLLLTTVMAIFFFFVDWLLSIGVSSIVDLALV
jgi:preprotein translocase subunit SecE